MASQLSFRRPVLNMALAVSLLVLAALAGLGFAGWLQHGEALWLAMAEGAWATCF